MKAAFEWSMRPLGVCDGPVVATECHSVLRSARVVSGFLWILLLCGSTAAQTAEQAGKALAGRGEVDEIRWSDPSKGQAFRVGIVRALPEGLEVQRGMAKRVLPYDQIGGVKFGLSMGERQLLAEARPDAIPALRAFWEARRLTLKLAGSNAGDLGLALARALRQSQACEDARRIAQEIADQDNDPRRRGRAKAELDTLAFLEVMQGGKADEVEKRAWAVTEAADEGNPDLMLLVTNYLLQREFAALQKIETENPRWQEDEEAKPVRDRHYHRALDLALYPSLFHPRREAEAAEGLWQAAGIYRHTQETARETGALEDLVALYASSAHTEEARTRLIPLKAALDSKRSQEETKPEEKPKDPEPKSPPPPPKRYNLFED